LKRPANNHDTGLTRVAEERSVVENDALFQGAREGNRVRWRAVEGFWTHMPRGLDQLPGDAGQPNLFLDAVKRGARQEG